MQDHRPNDLLLLAGKILAIIMQIGMAIGATALVIVSIALMIFQGKVIEQYADKVGDPTVVFPIFLLIAVVLIGLAIVCALFIFFGKLRQIIGTVGEGDPFQPANAERLSLMGWLMLGVQLALIPATVIGTRLASYADDMEDVHLTVDSGFELDLTGILIVVLLFILSRVFKHGAAMREDLEGTV
jgi:hypothetical protein